MNDVFTNSLLVTLFLDKLFEHICLHTVKWYDVVSILIILFNINHLFAHS